MRGAIGAHQTGAVECKHHRQVLQRHVMDQLVVAALQKSGIDRQHRLDALAGHAGGKGDGMLLGNANVKVTVGKAPVKLDHARAFAHRGRDGHQPVVVRCHVAQPFAKHLREGLARLGSAFHQPHCRVKLARAVVGHRVGFGQLVALALFGDHMQELRAFEALDVLQHRDQRVKVVAIDRADVVESELFKQCGRHHHALGLLLQPFGQLQQRWHRAKHGLADVLGGGIELPAHQLRKVAVERTDRRTDAHVVVVQDDQQVAVGHAGVVQRFKGHAGGHGAVANDGHGAAVLALVFGRQRHAQRR